MRANAKINNPISHSTSSGPQNVYVQPGDLVSWSSDSVVTGGGFVICGTTDLPPAAPSPRQRPWALRRV